MTLLVLVRHGSTDWVGARLAGRLPGIRLNARGRLEALEAAGFVATLAVSAVYSSPLERAVETARIVAAPGSCSVTIRERLVDIDFGAWTGRSLAELRHDPDFASFNRQRTTFRASGVETARAVQARMVTELLEISHRHPNEAVAVVGHLDPLRSVLAHFLHMPLDALLSLELGPGSVSALELSDAESSVRFVNREPMREMAR